MQQEAIGKPSILFEDEKIVVVFKPNRMLVHRTSIDFYERTNLRKWLADLLGVKVDPVHRLDKPTSGLIVFSKDVNTLNFLKAQFLDREISKTYLAMVRGFTQESGTVEKALQKDKDAPLKDALTEYKTLYHIEKDYEISRYPTSRYSFVEVEPKTGRYHQIRLHFSHLRHPIIGDNRHGDRKHNQHFRDQLDHPALFLHASKLRFEHPDGARITIRAPLPEHFQRVLNEWDWKHGSGITQEESE